MTILTVNLGNYANDGTGDDLRTAFEKVNSGFTELDLTRVITAENLGTGAPIFLDKDSNILRFRSIKAGLNVSVVYSDDEITIGANSGLNSIEEDLSPVLGGDLNTNGFNLFTEDRPLDIIVTNDVLNIYNYDTSNGNLLTLTLNGLVVSGSNISASGTTFLGTFVGDELSIIPDLDLTLGSVNGSIFVQSPIISNSSITATNFVGQISDISNHELAELADVSDSAAFPGQALVWNGTAWGPATVGTGGVAEGVYDFGVLGTPINNALSLLLSFTPVDFDSITNPSPLIIDLGPIDPTTSTYTLLSTSYTVLEGQTITVSLITSNIANGTVIPYTITGVDSADISGANLTGNFVVNNNVSNLSITISSDLDIESTEILILTLDDITPTVALAIEIIDFSAEIDGGTPTSTFLTTLDGGAPGTTIFDIVIDGGTSGATGTWVEGGTPSTTFFATLGDGGTPSTTTFDDIYDGGTSS